MNWFWIRRKYDTQESKEKVVLKNANENKLTQKTINLKRIIEE